MYRCIFKTGFATEEGYRRLVSLVLLLVETMLRVWFTLDGAVLHGALWCCMILNDVPWCFAIQNGNERWLKSKKFWNGKNVQKSISYASGSYVSVENLYFLISSAWVWRISVNGDWSPLPHVMLIDLQKEKQGRIQSMRGAQHASDKMHRMTAWPPNGPTVRRSDGPTDQLIDGSTDRHTLL